MEQIFYRNQQGFCLRSKKSNRPQTVYTVFVLNGKQYKISTGAKCYPSQWNNGKVRSKTKLDMQNNQILSEKIIESKEKYLEMINYLCMQSVVTDYDNIVSNFFKYKGKGKKRKETLYLTELLRRVSKDKMIKDSTKRIYETYVNSICKFFDESGIPDTLESANYDTFKSYQRWCINRGNGIASVNDKIIKIKDLFKRLAKSRKYDFNYNNSGIDDIEKIRESDKETKKAKNNINLSEDAVMQLYNFNQGLTDRQIMSKDIFVLESLTGQRISDVFRLIKNFDSYEKETIQGLTFYKQYAKKTSTECLIPVNDVALSIIQKYKGASCLNNQRYDNVVNVDIKTVTRAMGWDKQITYSIMKNNQMVTITKPMCDLIHSHTARHTFISNMCRRGIGKELVIMITGHKDTQMIDEIYDNRTTDEKAVRLAEGMTGTKQQPQPTKSGEGMEMAKDMSE
jgi:site-specific recombinase XerD